MAKYKEPEKNIDTFLTKDFFVFFGVFIGIITLVLVIKLFQANFQFIYSLTFLPILAGLYFEQKRLGYSWKEILFKSFSSYCVVSLALLISLQNKGDYSSIETDFLPITFIISFIAISIAYAYFLEANYKITAQVSDGTLLLQSISTVYLLSAEGFWTTLDFIKTLASIAVFMFCGYSLLNAFVIKNHTRTAKLYLSVGSSLLTLAFSVYYFLKISNLDISGPINWEDRISGFIAFFLFGSSIIYAAQNFWLIVRFLPERGEDSGSYKDRLRKLKKEHIERFIDQKVPLYSSLFCLIFVSCVYFVNYYYHLIPSHTMIWLVFTFFPFIIYFWELLFVKRAKNP